MKCFECEAEVSELMDLDQRVLSNGRRLFIVKGAKEGYGWCPMCVELLGVELNGCAHRMHMEKRLSDIADQIRKWEEGK